MATGTAIRAEQVRVERTIAPRLVDIEGAASYLGTSSKTIRRLIQAGELPYIQHIRGRSPYLLDVRDLDAWILRNKQSVAE